MTTELCFIDTETTGLDPRIHQPYEVSYWLESAPEPRTIHLPHTLDYADAAALRIGNYFERGFEPFPSRGHAETDLIAPLCGVTLVGANPGFDAAMLTRFIGAPVWHYRLIDVESMAMALFDWPRPQGLTGIVEALQSEGYEIPEQTHTAEGDVRTTRAVYEALRAFRARAR